MYCGDETGAFIGDVGSNTSRFGYGGEDNPKYVVPSYVGYDDDNDTKKTHIPTSCYHDRTSNLKSIYRLAKYDENDAEKPQVDPTAFLQQGDVVEDWDAYEHVWQTSFDVLHVRDTFKHTKGGTTTTSIPTSPISTKSVSGITSSTVRATPRTGEGKCVHPLLAVSAGCTHVMGSNDDNGDDNVGAQYDAAVHRKHQTKLTELFMEKMDASAMFIAPTPMLAAFSHGRQTGIVVDIGAGGCRVTPVVDGLVLKHAQRRTGRGGDWLGNVQLQALQTENIKVQPRYQIQQQEKQPSSSSSSVFHRWALQDVMYEFRTSHHVTLAPWRMDNTTPFVYPDAQDDDDDAMQVDPNSESTYELPDGTMIDLTNRVGKDLCRLPELLFTNDVPFVPEENATDDQTNSLLAENGTLSNLPLHKLIHASLTAVGDADARKELCGNILLTGASSLFPSMEQRLSLELTTVVPSTYKCRVIASRNSIERKYAAWIGGSILTSLGSFQQLWLSRTEYEEYGATLAIQRFP